jgi:hypothetical protein
MKKYLILFLYLLTFPAFSQVKGISYQAVILITQELPGADNTAAALSEQNVSLKFKFNDADNTNEYEEIIFTRTDLYGMVNVIIGTGERIGGTSASFGEIEWNSDPKFLDVSLDKDGLGADYKAFSRQEFTAVPFALFASYSGNTTAGIQGIQGETGIQGGIGLTGNQGIQGETGNQGETGAAGIPGKVGLMGAQGPSGIAGNQGIQGLQGEIGTKGLTGAKGSTGEVGLTGLQGTVGDTGTQGIQGAQGTVGTTGNQGIQGVIGNPGIQGAQGAKGDIGDLGLPGLQGTVGAAGNQGIQGVQGEPGIAASTATFVNLSADQTVGGSKTFTETIAANISGNAATTTTNANLTGAVTSVGNATLLANGVVTNPKLDKANIPLSGFGVAVADIDIGANKLTGIADPISAQDAATKNYVDRAYVINSITEGNIITTSSTQNLLMGGMTLSPGLGTYLALFNGQMTSNAPFTSNQGDLDVRSLYAALTAATVTSSSHLAVFGNSEILQPGVYDLASAALSISGTLTLDGLGNPNSLFIIRTLGAITTGANATVILTNQAVARNVFWVSGGTISTTDPTIMKGTLIGNIGAIALGANTDLEGRVFTTTGALTLGAGSNLSIPTGESGINLGVLSSFAMFTSVGAVGGGDCEVVGDVGTGLGVISGFTNSNNIGTVYPAGSVANTSSSTSYSIYQNGVEVLNSSRTTNVLNDLVSLQSIVSITTANTPIEIYWKVNSGNVKIGTRNLSLIRLGN